MAPNLWHPTYGTQPMVPKTQRVETRCYLYKTRLRGFQFITINSGNCGFNFCEINSPEIVKSSLKPAQAGFVCVAIGFNLWHPTYGTQPMIPGAQRVETRLHFRQNPPRNESRKNEIGAFIS